MYVYIKLLCRYFANLSVDRDVSGVCCDRRRRISRSCSLLISDARQRAHQWTFRYTVNWRWTIPQVVLVARCIMHGPHELWFFMHSLRYKLTYRNQFSYRLRYVICKKTFKVSQSASQDSPRNFPIENTMSVDHMAGGIAGESPDDAKCLNKARRCSFAWMYIWTSHLLPYVWWLMEQCGLEHSPMLTIHTSCPRKKTSHFNFYSASA